jgi:hypothetical protein
VDRYRNLIRGLIQCILASLGVKADVFSFFYRLWLDSKTCGLLSDFLPFSLNVPVTM